MSEPSKRPAGSIFLYAALGLGAVYLVLQLLRPGGEPISYSEFKALVAADRVAEATVGSSEITGQLADTFPDKTDAALPAKVAAVKPGSRVSTRPVPDDEALVPLLEKHGVAYTGSAESGGTIAMILSFLLPVALLAGFWMWMMRRMRGGPQGGMLSTGKSPVRVIDASDLGVTFADVAGVDEAKEELREIVDFLQRPERYARIGARIPRGVMLFGPPGTGKTLLARAVAGEARVPFFLMSGSDFVEMFVGVGASRVRDLFEQAKKKAPCIIFVDELDALGKTRGPGGISGANDEREQTLNQLLVEMDGFAPTDGVILVAATNRPETLDPALLRPGRFDRQVAVDRPDLRGREAILRVHARGVHLGDDIDLKVVAARTPGFAGADLANLINEAALHAVRRDGRKVTMADFDSATERIVAGLEKKGRIITPREKRIVAYHELGHAIVGERLEGADPVHSVSIVPRGMAALGFTWQRPTEDRYLMTRTELRDRIAALLGGRAAEEVVFGEISTGAENDLARATDIARSMVRSYGMSEALGPISYERQTRPHSLGEPPETCERSASTADIIDREVRSIVLEQMKRAQDILAADRAVMDELADTLIRKENLSGEEVRKALGLPAEGGTVAETEKEEEQG